MTRRAHTAGAGRAVAAAAAAVALASMTLCSPTESGFAASVTYSRNSAAMRSYWTCDDAVRSPQQPPLTAWWPLDDAATSPSIRSLIASGDAANSTGTKTSIPVADSACPFDARTATGLTSSLCAASSRTYPLNDSPGVTLEVWFRRWGGWNAGRLIGFSNDATILTFSEPTTDRIIFVDDFDNVGFYVWNRATGKPALLTTTTGAYHDHRWHLAAATLGPRGQELYVDGVLVASNGSVTLGGAYAGGAAYLKLGCGNTTPIWNAYPASGKPTLSDRVQVDLQHPVFYQSQLDAKTLRLQYVWTGPSCTVSSAENCRS